MSIFEKNINITIKGAVHTITGYEAINLMAQISSKLAPVPKSKTELLDDFLEFLKTKHPLKSKVIIEYAEKETLTPKNARGCFLKSGSCNYVGFTNPPQINIRMAINSSPDVEDILLLLGHEYYHAVIYEENKRHSEKDADIFALNALLDFKKQSSSYLKESVQ